ncbi:MAG: 3-hydroxylacyl-ACP dehydratase [Treponema sp.]|nr:3-hydroxylacyl-ACP dehydratase [Treponema sp.]
MMGCPDSRNYPPAASIIIDGDELLSLLPHKGKMLLLSRITRYDVHNATLSSEYDLNDNCVFFDTCLGGVPSWMSFEFMAQTVSALSGLTGRILGKTPMIGFVLSVSSYDIKAPLFKAGDVVCTTVSEKMRIAETSIFNCTVSLKGAEVSQAQLTLMDVEDPEVFTTKESYGA